MIHRVLHIPEILSLIFKFSDIPVRRNAALVCKLWMEPALDQLWRSVTPLALFQLLAPMRLIDTHPVEPLVGIDATNLKILISHSFSSGSSPRTSHPLPGRVSTFMQIVFGS